MDMHLLDNNKYTLWQDYVINHTNATLYHLAEWKSIVETSFGHRTFYVMVFDKGAVVGILPIVYIKSLIFGKILCSLPYLNFAGILADAPDIENFILEECYRILNKLGADYFELRHLRKMVLVDKTQEHKVSMTIELNNDPQVLWENFESKHRREIRRASKNNLEIRVGNTEFLGEFYEIISQGWHDLGTPIYSYSFFKNILETFNKSINIFLVYHKGRPIATALNGLFRDTIEGMWTYSLRNYQSLHTNYFLYWEMIKTYSLQGYKYFHLGRSTKDTGSVFFKKKWNAVPKQLYWQYILPENSAIPNLNVDNPKFKFYINIWKNLPVKLTQIFGPPIAKNIP